MIEPYGGTLVSRIITSDAEREESLLSGLKQIEISADVLLEVENIAFGLYSPLTGFPSSDDFNEIIDHWRLKSGLPFSIPPLCHIGEQDFHKIEENKKILLSFKGNPVAVMHVNEKFRFERKRFLDQIFKTTNPEHPGVSFVMGVHEYLISGEIFKLSKDALFFNGEALTPAELRNEITSRGWHTITAFSTTNIPHRAHEYLQRVALDVSDGLLIHPLLIVGTTPKFTIRQIDSCYRALIDNYFPKKNVLFSFLPILPRSAGPRSAMLQGIIRQNFGCTHQIIGRDHDGFKSYYSNYESQQIFDQFPEIGLMPLKLRGPYYCETCCCIVTEKNCSHSENGIAISGTILREKIQLGEQVPDYFIRKEVLKSLMSN